MRARRGSDKPTDLRFDHRPLDKALDFVRKPANTAKPKSMNDAPRAAPRAAETLDQTLEMLAKNEVWADPDSVSDTGVRHLKVEVHGRR